MAMPEQEASRRRAARAPRALDSHALRDLALAYAARYATTAAKLERYLAGKLRTRGWAGEGEPDLAGLVARMVQFGYIDDAAYARGREASLLRRGYGPRRIAQALAAAGIAEDLRRALPAGEGDARRAALAFASRRRLGPFGPRPADAAAREKQIAAMIRAGHRLDSAREIVDAASVEAAEQWAAEAIDQEG